MNEQYKEAFEKFYLPKRELMWEHLHGDQIAFDVWLAACEYKDAQIEQAYTKGFNNGITAENARSIEALEQERAKSAKLVEALEEIKRCCDEGEFLFVSSTIREALAEYKAKEGGE